MNYTRIKGIKYIKYIPKPTEDKFDSPILAHTILSEESIVKLIESMQQEDHIKKQKRYILTQMRTVILIKNIIGFPKDITYFVYCWFLQKIITYFVHC